MFFHWSIKWSSCQFGIILYTWGIYLGLGKYDLRLEYRKKTPFREIGFLLNRYKFSFIKNYDEHILITSDNRDYPNKEVD
jgi:hypothetical protein